MKHWYGVIGLSVLLINSVAAQAVEFNRYSNEELLQLREQVRYMDSADRDAYRAERQLRLQSMSETERMEARSRERRDLYLGAARETGGQTGGKGSRKRDGSGGGQGKRHRQGGGRRDE